MAADSCLRLYIGLFKPHPAIFLLTTNTKIQFPSRVNPAISLTRHSGFCDTFPLGVRWKLMRLEAQRKGGLCCVFLYNDDQGSLNEKWREISWRKLLYVDADDGLMNTKKPLSSIHDKFDNLLKVVNAQFSH
jgi:hypothetical protein